MAQAGIEERDPVLIAGWSLGGILAGHLAQSGAGGYTYAGVVVAGAPIDHLAMPAGTAVLQVKHTTDPVHRLDLIDAVPDTSASVSVWDGQRSGLGEPVVSSPNLGHDAAAYAQTLAAHLADDPSLGDPFAALLAADDPLTAGVPVVEHMQFAFDEGPAAKVGSTLAAGTPPGVAR